MYSPNISTNASAITSLQTSVSNIEDELESTATALTLLEATVTDPATGLSSKASAEDLTTVEATLDDVTAERTIKVQVRTTDGKLVMAGMGLIASSEEDQSELYLLADKVAILNTLDGTPTALFQEGTTYLNSAIINELTADTITATSIIRSTDGKMVLDFTNKTISITV